MAPYLDHRKGFAPHHLTGTVSRWRAAPHALPALIRDHHSGTPADRGAPNRQPEDPNDNDRPGAAFLGIMAALVIYVICGVIYGLWMGGHDRL